MHAHLTEIVAAGAEGKGADEGIGWHSDVDRDVEGVCY